MKRGLVHKIFDCFSTTETFTLQDAYEAIDHKPKEIVRARIYKNLGAPFERVNKGVNMAIKGESSCVVMEGNSRDLSMLQDESIDGIITDNPWLDEGRFTGQKGGCCYE